MMYTLFSPSFLAWFYWNPNPNIFTIPFLDHPLKWYGLFFVAGFALGYWLLVPLLSKKLEATPQFLPRDVANWPLLATFCKNALHDKQNPIHPFVSSLSKSQRKLLTQLKQHQQPDAEQRDLLLQLLNTYTALGYTRQKLISLFPKALYTTRDLGMYLTDRFTWFAVIGTVIGARLGHVFFYDWPHFKTHPIDIIKIWEGGLASHGGTIGVFIMLFFYCRMIRKRFPELTFLTLLDLIVVPTALVAVCIRLGNFMNQEIVGIETTVPWAVIFGQPAEGGVVVPRHPAQLYEAWAYCNIFILLYYLWRSDYSSKYPGLLSGLFFILVFGSRFLIEFIKPATSLQIDESYLLAGQLLSLPFILLGLFLISFGPRLVTNRSLIG